MGSPVPSWKYCWAIIIIIALVGIIGNITIKRTFNKCIKITIAMLTLMIIMIIIIIIIIIVIIIIIIIRKRRRIIMLRRIMLRIIILIDV